MRIRQSDLASFQRCAQQVKLKEQAKEQGWHEPILSATAAGTVMHYAFQTLQKLHHEGREDALDVAIATLQRYWDPSNISMISEGPVDVWIANDTYHGMLRRHTENLKAADAWIRRDKSILLSIEHTFDVPIVIDGEEHTLHGTVDRLCLRMISGRPVLGVDDLKTWRKKHYYLDSNTQATVYSYASLQPEFWNSFYEDETVLESFHEVVERLSARGLQLYQGLRKDLTVIPRRARFLRAWDGFEVNDAGWREEPHFARMRAQLREYIAARRAGVYPLTVDGSICRFCPFNLGICGDVPGPQRQEGIA